MVARPILDVARGVAAGFEVVPHAVPAPTHDPRLYSLLDQVPTLPRNTFLMVPLPVRELLDPTTRSALLRPSTLGGTVFDLTEVPVSGPTGEQLAVLAQITRAGGMLALGGGDQPQPDLSLIAAVGPSIIRLGGPWLRGIEASAAKQAALRAVGELASDRDAWILLSDVASISEMRVLADLGVPLATGPLVGEPGTGWPAINLSILPALTVRPREVSDTLRQLLVATPSVFTEQQARALLDRNPAMTEVVVLDPNRRPELLVTARPGSEPHVFPALKVNVDTELREVRRRLAARPPVMRQDPVAVTDNAGRFLGLVRAGS